ncbi:D-arabinono-1,4-lactone oxidase [Pseudobacteriovorax antillogorgiicola]|uniref:FAD/FMN-containing dehydrogenase n=1 Tax=Pseudobacteriovorax antillogorgiicola TaxID=1513793 RepID=A0A1Y6BCV7_9BACT|nr:D-arabinono-1,4-lactone oxidase [Pseudobacteriovorax antillogorgiicola]TCS57423.1 FAD/FMN-containing dehydrogenase [Pseudobacteriovorax antillogorgiicola]SMF01280.1 FAD/FMN-containing dehydrogenase [Pseudobacteriovorax antillogorgiicola]
MAQTAQEAKPETPEPEYSKGKQEVTSSNLSLVSESNNTPVQSKKKIFENWSHNIRVQPREYYEPKTLDELQSLVARSSKIKAVGSGHSFNCQAYTDQTMISLKHLNRILDVDRDNRRIRVEAGKSLHDFNKEIESYGMVLPSLGGIDKQSLAGACSTATHGSGLKWGTLSDESSIFGMELIQDDGSVLELRADRPSDREGLMAARVNLGVLGIIYAITFKLEESRCLELRSKPLSLEEAQDQGHYLKNDHFEYLVFPFTDTTEVTMRNRTSKTPKPHPIIDFYHDIFLKNWTVDGLNRCNANLNLKRTPAFVKFLAGMIPNERKVSMSWKNQPGPRTVRFFQAEYAVKLGLEAEIQQALDQLTASLAKSETFFANLPVQYRFVKGDQGSFLSPSLSTEPICYINLSSHLSYPNWQTFFEEAEKILMQYQARPQWGKQFYNNPVIQGLYPEFEAFMEFKKAWDPNGKFTGLFFEKLVAGEKSPYIVK